MVDGSIPTSLFLTCSINPSPPPLLPSTPIHWVLPNGETVGAFISASEVNGQYSVIAIPEFGNGGVVSLGFNLLIENIAYSNAGTYICEYVENDEILSATVELFLTGIYAKLVGK